ncbi:MAG: beta-phosphoglucomutase family hydrolase [Anaerolineae bacterium]|nr:beta-phosphoglucomutase family hydrolase [Anaerolineae bacterium]
MRVRNNDTHHNTAIKGFIFDLDGVLTDTQELHFLSWQQVCAEEGIPFDHEISDRLRGIPRVAALDVILNGLPYDDSARQSLLARKAHYFLGYVDQLAHHDRLPGVTRFLDEARAAGLRLGVGSASVNARRVLRQVGLADHFVAIGDGNSVPVHKPAPDIFLWVADQLGLKPSQAVVFEDGAAGIEAALAGGFWTVGLGDRFVQRAHLVVPGFDALTAEGVLRAFGQDESCLIRDRRDNRLNPSPPR